MTSSKQTHSLCVNVCNQNCLGDMMTLWTFRNTKTTVDTLCLLTKHPLKTGVKWKPVNTITINTFEDFDTIEHI